MDGTVPVLGAEVEEGRVAVGFWLVAMVVGLTACQSVVGNVQAGEAGSSRQEMRASQTTLQT